MRRGCGRALRAAASRPHAASDPGHRGSAALGLADALSALRLALAALLPLLLVRGGPAALAVWAVAAATDYVDGPIARRRGGSRWGGVLDVVADVAFVLAGLATAAAAGLVPVAAPAAVVCSVAAYAAASARASGDGSVHLARSRLGHWAGIANWACVGLVAGAQAVPGPAIAATLRPAGLVVAAMNAGAAAARLLPHRTRLPGHST